MEIKERKFNLVLMRIHDYGFYFIFIRINCRSKKAYETNLFYYNEH